ncbi:MAG: type II methionyl aminopeptidase [Candidatus Aenigmarchaeota archaeon]|nr:type II methionyl aminopeptidase [Candidatus Aenigmarchaeota archaeon]MDW8159984.1 type II methionyl aminopeptidase [Candidatus Aenigmarchaeota archaeon]
MEEIEKYKEVFEKAKKVLEFSEKLVKPGVNIIEIAEKIESKILELGSKPAFPVNIGINEIAAHYTPSIKDDKKIGEDDLVKIDIGLHVEGIIGDFAFSFSENKEDREMIKVAKMAVEEAGKILRENVKIKEISATIESFVEKTGFKIVRNLTGHLLDKYVVHGISIPNVRNENNIALKKGQALAIEVFVTKGEGWVKEGSQTEIYQFKKDVGVRNIDGKKILKMAEKDFEGLPFAKRWIKEIPQTRLEIALKELVEKGGLIGYPVLKEVSKAKVAQWEESFVIE